MTDLMARRSGRENAVKNIIEIDSHKAVASLDPDTQMLRGELVNLNGGADFCASSVSGLIEEGRVSLRLFLDTCKENGLQSYRLFSGKFNLRLPPRVHEAAVIAAAAAQDKSLNEWVAEKIEQAVLEDA